MKKCLIIDQWFPLMVYAGQEVLKMQQNVKMLFCKIIDLLVLKIMSL